MCRNIKPLFNFDPPATDEEIREASLQFVRKISGMNKPSVVNYLVFDHAIDEISASAKKLFGKLKTESRAKNREVEDIKHRKKIAQRFAGK